MIQKHITTILDGSSKANSCIQICKIYVKTKEAREWRRMQQLHMNSLNCEISREAGQFENKHLTTNQLNSLEFSPCVMNKI